MMSSVLLSVPLSLASSPKYQWIDYFITILTLDPAGEAACLQQGGHPPRRPPSLSWEASTRGKLIWLQHQLIQWRVLPRLASPGLEREG